jgi:signal transduction histidine kinase
VPPEKILTLPISDSGMQWDWPLVRRGLNACREDRHVVELDNVEYRNLNGQSGFINIVLTPALSAESKNLEVVLLATDITNRRSMEAQLRQAQKLKVIGQLAAGIAHEINTPAQYIGDNTRFLKDAFTSITGAIQACEGLLANRNNLTPELLDQTAAILKTSDLEYLSQQIPSAIDEALEGIDRVSEIVRAMKDFSHPGSTEKTAANLNKAIESTVTVSRSEWKYAADMTLDLDKTIPTVPCLPGEFSQVILNLIVNAAHAIEDANRERHLPKGRITIKTQATANHVEVRVSDTGTGIPESARQKLFEPFFTTKDVGKGTGQGLFIAHSVIVEKHGGTIHFETEIGSGTTFVIRLPLVATAKNETTPQPEPGIRDEDVPACV